VSQQDIPPPSSTPPRRELRPFVDAGVLVPVALWVALVLLAYWLRVATGEEVVICMFRRLTGVPCATCGGTRATMALARGELDVAWAFNPLVTVLLVTLPLLALWRATFGRRRSPLGRKGQRVVIVVLLAALAINWVYVVRHERALSRAGAAQRSP